MTDEELLPELLALAEQVGLSVQSVRGAPLPELGPVASSGVCRLRGETRVLLLASDPLAERIRVLAAALREHAGGALEGRYLPPALRQRLEGEGD